ncbi:MAG: rod shape-determining protein MreD, partial [Herminiimonas sp.]|nr:rod shape-determining protein MreD [Herminiimonas sp.]
MNNPHFILLPVSPAFIIVSLIIAFLMNMLPWGHLIGVPDFVALVVIFWSINQPRKVGIGVAFFMGLMMDVHEATLLGENALAYTLLSYFAIMIHRRVLWFPSG